MKTTGYSNCIVDDAIHKDVTKEMKPMKTKDVTKSTMRMTKETAMEVRSNLPDNLIGGGGGGSANVDDGANGLPEELK